MFFKIWWTYFIKTYSDTQTYITFNFCHPKRCKNNITFTLPRRIYVIVKQWSYKKRLGTLLAVLHSQEYSQTLTQEAIWKAASIPIKYLRTSNASTDSNNLTLIKAFVPNNKNRYSLFQRAFKTLQQWHQTKECFKDIKFKKVKDNNLI